MEELSAAAIPAPGSPVILSERDRLAKAIEGDPELLGLTARLLRARAIALAAASERDVVAHALDDLRPFSPARSSRGRARAPDGDLARRNRRQGPHALS